MPRLLDWLGSLMFLVALIQFVPSPRKALQSISGVLATNPKMVNGHLFIAKTQARGIGNSLP